MKYFKFFPLLLLSALVLTTACNDDKDDVDLSDYKAWRAKNDQWIVDMQNRKNPDGTPYYQVYVPAWNPGAFVLMHFFNDRAETAENLVPLYTSVVDVIYEGYDCEDEMFDSSKSINQYGRTGVQRIANNSSIQGWAIAMENMHVGDTAEVIMPYQVAYGASVTGTIMPYSALRFNMRLYDIYKYEGNAN